MRRKLFKAVNNVTLCKCYTDCKDVSRSLLSKAPFAKALPLSLKQEEGHKEKEKGKSKEPNVHDPP